MKRPTLGKGRNRAAQPKPPARAETAGESEVPTMAVADPAAEAPTGAAETAADESKVVRPKIQTTVREEDAAAFKAYCESKQLTPNVALRVILAEALGYELPPSEYTAVTRHKYDTPEEAKAAAKARDKERRDEMAEALAFFRKARSEGKV